MSCRWSLAACMLACCFVVGACATRAARAAGGPPEVRDGWASHTLHGRFVSVNNNRANPILNTCSFGVETFPPFDQPGAGIGIGDGRSAT
jgi:hypothetical protein